VGAHLHSKGIMHGDFYAHNTLINANAEILMGDFGAASLYNINDTTIAESLEKIEVNAWACMLDDLLLNLKPIELGSTTVLALNIIKEKTMQSVVLRRPTFKEVQDMLMAIV
jgi:serine/threonine protein kinase